MLRAICNFVGESLIKPCTTQVLIQHSPSLQTAGLGGMKPNTLVMGYYDSSIPESQLNHLQKKVEKLPRVVRSLIRDQGLEKYHYIEEQLPPLRKRVSYNYYTLNAGISPEQSQTRCLVNQTPCTLFCL